jgi:hypothetical protein
MRTHPLNVSYLVLGLAFLGIAGSWALHETGVIESGDMEWLLPLTLVVAGAIGLVAFMARGLTGRRTDDSTTASYTTDTYTTYDTEPTLFTNDQGDNR